MVSPNSQREMTVRDALKDGAISITLIVIAWAAKEIVTSLFPDGAPFPISLILPARDLITLLWVMAVTARYFKIAYREVNSAISGVLASQLWKRSRAAVSFSLTAASHLWVGLDRASREITFLIFVVVLSYKVFSIRYNPLDLFVPPLYWAASVYMGHVLERVSKGRFKPNKRFWLTLLLIFLIIEIWIILGPPTLVDTLGNLISVDNELRLLIALCAFYLFVTSVYHRHRSNWSHSVHQYVQRVLSLKDTSTGMVSVIGSVTT